MADDSFSKKIRDLPFLKSSKETKNIYSIDKNSFQDWLKISLKKYIEGSGNLYTTSQLRAFSEGLMKLSSDMRESEEFKSLEKTFKENQGLFSEAPVPEQVRDVNQSFKTANELISKLKKSPYATPEEKSSYDRMQTVNDQFASDFGIVFSKIIDICMANPYEYLSKTVISLNKLGSENDGVIKKIEDIENNLKKSPLYNYIIENPSISI